MGLWILVIVIVVIAIFLIMTYNRLVNLRQVVGQRGRMSPSSSSSATISCPIWSRR